jgi:hypothetical protein
LVLAACGDGGDPPAADAGPPCPVEPQLGDERCDAEGQRCLYLRCPDDAAYESRCEGGAWVSTRRPCATHECDAMRCDSTALCVQTVRGGLRTQCVENPCGPDAVEASCACGLCDTSRCHVTGRLVRCDDCPDDFCR